MDFSAPTFPMQLDFREIGRPLPLLVRRKMQESVLPPPAPRLEAATNQFATLVSRETGMQCDELSQKDGHKLP